MERDDLIEYSLHGHHDEAKGKEIIGKSIIYNLGECGYKIIKI